MEEKDKEFDAELNTEVDRREYRRKRRIRNQIIGYVSVIIVFAVIITGAVIGIRTIVKGSSEKKQAEELAKQLEEMSQQEAEAPVVEPPVQEETKTEADWLEEMVDACITEMPLEDKVAGLFMITPEALTGVDKAIKAGDGTKEALNQYAVGGLVYFKQNIQDQEQLTTMLANTASMSKYPLFLAVDEEGGKVRRVGGSSIDVPEVEDMADIGAQGDTSKAYDAGATLASYLYELGFNVDFAPDADVVTDASTSAVGKRSFGGDAAVVSDMVAAAVSGIQDTGLSACVKHFPGIGSTTADTHEGMAVIEKSNDELKASDFLPFKAGIDAGVHFVMVSHASAPNIVGDDTPCSLSGKVITDTLRGELGYNGIVITDAMNMSAVTESYSADQAAVMALQAGVDIILMPDDFKAAYEGVLAAVKDGTITEERVNESLKRIYRIKYRDRLNQGTQTEEAAAPDAETDATANEEDMTPADGAR